MIDGEGRILCGHCIRRKSPTRMAEVRDGMLILWGKHHGAWHEESVAVLDLLPEPGTEEYAGIVVELLRRASD